MSSLSFQLKNDISVDKKKSLSYNGEYSLSHLLVLYSVCNHRKVKERNEKQRKGEERKVFLCLELKKKWEGEEKGWWGLHGFFSSHWGVETRKWGESTFFLHDYHLSFSLSILLYKDIYVSFLKYIFFFFLIFYTIKQEKRKCSTLFLSISFLLNN